MHTVVSFVTLPLSEVVGLKARGGLFDVELLFRPLYRVRYGRHKRSANVCINGHGCDPKMNRQPFRHAYFQVDPKYYGGWSVHL